MKKYYTKEEKNVYFADLRKRWKESKTLADKDETVQALYKEVGGEFSYYSFFFTLMEMRNLGLDGVPYVDCKTYKGWQEAGFQVKKDEKSKLNGITWIGVEKKDEDGEKVGETDFKFPKLYHLFHKTQVEARGGEK